MAGTAVVGENGYRYGAPKMRAMINTCAHLSDGEGLAAGCESQTPKLIALEERPDFTW